MSESPGQGPRVMRDSDGVVDMGGGGGVDAKRFAFAAQPDADDAKIGSDAEPHRDI